MNENKLKYCKHVTNVVQYKRDCMFFARAAEADIAKIEQGKFWKKARASVKKIVLFKQTVTVFGT